ncbi:MAG: DoxX family membrane protein [Maribacter sp.]|nr:DoxX family membrane protein [Maribacter sp.]
MKIVLKVLQLMLALFFIYAGVQHVLKPLFYEPYVPNFMPYKTVIIYGSGLLEIALGILVLIPKYTKIGATGIIVLLLVFLPVHIADVFSDAPAIGNHKAAIIRLPVQFLFIAWAYLIRRSAVKWRRSMR